MLRLPMFRHHSPGNLDEALALLEQLKSSGEDAKVIAGGTDLVPNMKHEIMTPEHVVSLERLGLAGIEERDGAFHIGAMTTIQTLADDPLMRERLPAFVDACGQIAGPQLRRMGTLGGNICLDTRCLYINQSHFWRSSLGFCIKKDGDVCHVVAGGKNCVAAASNDSVLPLTLYGAEVRLLSARGERQLPIQKFYTADGVKNTVIEPDEILVEVIVPAPTHNVHVAFEKLRVRKSIDFPLLNVAVLVELDASDAIERFEMVVSALGARPKRMNLDKALRGKPLDQTAIDQAGRKAYASCRPLTNLATDPDWRREMVPVLIKKAVLRLNASN